MPSQYDWIVEICSKKEYVSPMSEKVHDVYDIIWNWIHRNFLISTIFLHMVQSR